jgi:hypothetical protein
MLAIETGDTVVAKPNNGKSNKPFLMKVESISKGIAQGIMLKDSHIAALRGSAEIPLSNVLAVVDGTDPHPGRVFGCDTKTIYQGKKTLPLFGSLHWFYKPSKEVGDGLVRGFNKVEKILKAQRLEFIVDPGTCVWEVYKYDGEKYGGWYKRSRAPDKNPHRLKILPEGYEPQKYPYVILHEYAHHLHSEYVTGKKLNGAWIRLYNTSIKVAAIPKEKSLEILDNLLDQEDLPSDFKGQLEEQDAIAFKWIVKAIQQQHKLSLKEIDLLFEADYKDDIREIWPTRGLTSSDLDPVVSEYATKNVRELFAEAVSFHLTGVQIPKAAINLVEKSLSYARSAAGKS